MFSSLFSSVRQSPRHGQSRFSALKVSNEEASEENSFSEEPSVDDAERVIDSSLREMENVIERLNTAKNRAQAERNESRAMLESYIASHKNLSAEIKRFIQSGRSEAAKPLLEEQQSLENVIVSFERITANMTASVQKLTAQIDSMRIQREELKARRSVLASQLISAKSHEEFVEKLKQSGASHELLERETIHAELRYSLSGDESENALTSTISSALQSPSAFSEQAEFNAIKTENALKALESRIEAEIADERAEKERLNNEASLKRFQMAFGTIRQPTPQAAPILTPKVPAEKDTKRQMDEFFAADRVKPAFPAPNSQPQQTDQAPKESQDSNEDRIKNFFSHNP